MLKIKSRSVILLMVLMMLTPQFLRGKNKILQEKSGVLKLDKKKKTVIINSICKELKENYIFPDVSKKIGLLLKKNLKRGRYKKITNAIEFGRILTIDIRKVNNDKHLRINFRPRMVKMIKERKSKSKEKNKDAFNIRLKRSRETNFGFKKVEILEGNIGYLDLRMFEATNIAGKTAVTAMNFLANSNAIIIDLRNNGGGSPSMIQLLSSYFFSHSGNDDGGVHLNSFEYRAGKEMQQFWTLPYVPGKLMVDKDLYILTSRRTFSAAEEFTYNMKNLKRATIIGEITGGGAHPGEDFIIGKNYVMFIPFGRAINPVTKKNWEGVGVKPDITVSKEIALNKAHYIALEKLIKKAKDPNRRNKLNWVFEGIKSEINRVDINEKELIKYIGNYSRNQKIKLKKGTLIFNRQGQDFKLIPMSNTKFKIESIDFVRIEFVLNKKGIVTGFFSLLDNGRKMFVDKTE